METILEQQRRYHEEKERLMDVMAKEMLTKKSTVSGVWAEAASRLGPIPVFNLGELSLVPRSSRAPPPAPSGAPSQSCGRGKRPPRPSAPRGLGCRR